MAGINGGGKPTERERALLEGRAISDERKL